ncbi:hypothetical protein J7J35_04000 [Candidatus Bipolaricaulota bacterium]|nr:hypothetical protein [Candidatus Bipolaricaulota bacterium]
MTRALVLYSGSLASRIALKLAKEVRGLELKVIYFRSPFFHECEGLEQTFRELARCISFRTKTLKREFLHIALGSGGLPFPCGACRRVLLSRAARMARRLHAEYIITGEVVGKGGMDEDKLARLDAELGLVGHVIRPVSGRLLSPTRAELQGVWPREALFDITVDEPGRMRALGEQLGLAGGVEAERRCSLSNPVYARRLVDVLGEGLPTVNTLRLLEFKHFFFIPPDLKVVVATDPEEQAMLQTLFLPTDVRLYLPLPRSPLVLARADWSRHAEKEREQAVVTAASIALALAGFPDGETCDVCFRFEWEEETRRLVVTSPGKAQLSSLLAGGLMPSPVGVYSLG